MKLTVVENHDGEGIFPTFKDGMNVSNITLCKNFRHWVSGEIQGYSTYFPVDFVNENKLICDYNPTELSLLQDERVKLVQVAYEWALVEDGKGRIGWIPFEKLTSLNSILQ